MLWPPCVLRTGGLARISALNFLHAHHTDDVRRPKKTNANACAKKTHQISHRQKTSLNPQGERNWIGGSMYRFVVVENKARCAAVVHGYLLILSSDKLKWNKSETSCVRFTWSRDAKQHTHSSALRVLSAVGCCWQTHCGMGRASQLKFWCVTTS